jgi:hypothetical protein
MGVRAIPVMTVGMNLRWGMVDMMVRDGQAATHSRRLSAFDGRKAIASLRSAAKGESLRPRVTGVGRRASGNLLAGSWELAAGSGQREACSLLRVLPLNLHHTAIAVRDLDAALAEFKRLYGVAPITREKVEDQGVEEAMVPLGGSFIQLLMPLGDDTPVGRFVTKRGEGMHHIAFQVTRLFPTSLGKASS